MYHPTFASFVIEKTYRTRHFADRPWRSRLNSGGGARDKGSGYIIVETRYAPCVRTLSDQGLGLESFRLPARGFARRSFSLVLGSSWNSEDLSVLRADTRVSEHPADYVFLRGIAEHYTTASLASQRLACFANVKRKTKGSRGPRIKPCFRPAFVLLTLNVLAPKIPRRIECVRGARFSVANESIRGARLFLGRERGGGRKGKRIY